MTSLNYGYDFKENARFFAAIIFFALAISFVAFNMNYFDPLDLAIRLLALNGFLALSIAAILTPFIKEVTLFFKKSFLNIHHYFAAAGLLLITLHPVAIVIQALNPALLLPDFGSFYLFLFYGGSVALIAIYAAFGAVLLRKKLWRIGVLSMRSCMWRCSLGLCRLILQE